MGECYEWASVYLKDASQQTCNRRGWKRRNEQTATIDIESWQPNEWVYTKITDQMLNFSVLSVVFSSFSCAFPFLRVIRVFLRINSIFIRWLLAIRSVSFALTFRQHGPFWEFYLLRNYCKSTKAKCHHRHQYSHHRNHVLLHTHPPPIQSIIFFIEHFKRIDIFASSNYSRSPLNQMHNDSQTWSQNKYFILFFEQPYFITLSSKFSCSLSLYLATNCIRWCACTDDWHRSNQNDSEAKRCAIVVAAAATAISLGYRTMTEKIKKQLFGKVWNISKRIESIRLNDIDVTLKKVTCRYAIAVRYRQNFTHRQIHTYACTLSIPLLSNVVVAFYQNKSHVFTWHQQTHTHAHTWAACDRSSNEKQRIRVQIRWTQLENWITKKYAHTHLTAATTTQNDNRKAFQRQCSKNQ